MGKTNLGRYRAPVTDNRDPEKRGRIKVNHPYISKDVWIEYLTSSHEYDPPEIGDIVFVEFEAGEVDFPIAHGKTVRGKKGLARVPSEFRRVVPTNRGFKSPSGHILEFDDGIYVATDNTVESAGEPENNTAHSTTENKGIRITTSGGNKIHIMEDNGFRVFDYEEESDESEIELKQYILIEDVNKNFIKIDYKQNKITISSRGSADIITDGDKLDNIGNNRTKIVQNSEFIKIQNSKYEEIDNDSGLNIARNKVESVGGDRTELVEGIHTEIIIKDKIETIKENKIQTITKDKTENITGNKLENIEQNKESNIKKNKIENIEQNKELNINQNKTETIGKNANIDIGSNLTTNISANANISIGGSANISASSTTITSPTVSITGNAQVTGISALGGGTPLLLATTTFIGVGNLGIPVISSVMSGVATKVVGS